VRRRRGRCDGAGSLLSSILFISFGRNLRTKPNWINFKLCNCALNGCKIP
jgi:hypothetical protein